MFLNRYVYYLAIEHKPLLNENEIFRNLASLVVFEIGVSYQNILNVFVEPLFKYFFIIN